MQIKGTFIISPEYKPYFNKPRRTFMIPHEYTRQRQGRDFTLQETLTRGQEESRKACDIAQRADDENKSLLGRLKKYREETERNSVPIDGHEPR
jgi:ribosomal protein L13E